jgi:hypothetical protein
MYTDQLLFLFNLGYLFLSTWLCDYNHKIACQFFYISILYIHALQWNEMTTIWKFSESDLDSIVSL